MNVKIAILAVLIFGIFLIGCAQKSDYTGYTSGGQPRQGQQQGQYVGGGCGVAPSGAYADNSAILSSNKPLL